MYEDLPKLELFAVVPVATAVTRLIPITSGLVYLLTSNLPTIIAFSGCQPLKMILM